MLTMLMLQEAWISLRSNKLRSFLTILGIVIGVCAVVLMVATGQTVRNEINKELESFGGNKLVVTPARTDSNGVKGKNKRPTTTYDDYKAISKIKDVNKAAPMVVTSAQVVYGSNNWATTIFGTTAEYLDIDDFEINDGMAFSNEDVENSLTYAIIGQTIVDKLFKEGQNPVGETIRIGNVPFLVVGTYKVKGAGSGGTDQDDVIIAPIFAVKRRLTDNKIPNRVSMIMIKADSNDVLSRLQKRVEVLLQERHKLGEHQKNDFDIMNLTEILKKTSRVGVILSILLASIASISLFVGSIGIMNMMLVSVTERTKEIGIRKAVGAKNTSIMLQFLFEAILIAMVGSVAGMVFGIGLSQIGGYLFNKSVPISVLTIVVSMFIAVMVGVASGIFPALKATKLNPIEALKY